MLEHLKSDFVPILNFQEKNESNFSPIKLKFTVKSQVIKDKMKQV